MYRDTGLIKKHATRVRTDDYLDRQIEAVCDLTGEQKAVAMRNLIELGLAAFHGVDISVVRNGVEGQLKSIFSH